jgi:exonuclease VII small subunit
MSFTAKCAKVAAAVASMESSKVLCLNDAVRLFQIGREDEANTRLEKAAQYAWGFDRPRGW